MARVLDEYSFNRGSYPDWSQYFDGQIHALEVGVDFEGDPKKAQSSIYQRAKAAGVSVKTDRPKDQPNLLIIKATGPRKGATNGGE